MNNKSEILDFLRSNRQYLLNHFHVTKVALFGSFARDEANEKSDIDLLIELEKDTVNIYELKNELKYYLSKAFNRPVDLAREKYLKPYAKEHILKDAIYV